MHIGACCPRGRITRYTSVTQLFLLNKEIISKKCSHFLIYYICKLSTQKEFPLKGADCFIQVVPTSKNHFVCVLSNCK